MHIGFSLPGLIVFALPMIVNIAYCIFPPSDQTEEKPSGGIAEKIEQASRMVFMVLMCFLICTDRPDFRSPVLYTSLLFLVLYHVVWIRYFAGGRKCRLMTESFLFIPIPLAVFPVLYFFLAAFWLGNWPAAAVMVIFGISHLMVSKRSVTEAQ